MDPILIDQLPQAAPLYGVKLYEQPTFIMPWHMHDFYELTLILDGFGTRIVGDSIDSFYPGDLLLLGPRLPHVWKDDRTTGGGLARAISLQFASSFPSGEILALPQMHCLAEMLESARRGLLLRGQLAILTRAKVDALLECDETRQLILILEILTDIADSGEYSQVTSRGYVTPDPAETQRWTHINDYILKHFRRPLPANELAQVAGMHPSSLGRYIKRTTGKTLTEYVNEIRIGHACRLLATDNRPVVEICFECGFQNLSHFNRRFRRSKGASPTEYRKAVRRAF
jgi:AraC-like DNA-binding protein